MARDTAVMYFAAVAADGRRSSVWRVWTGNPNRPTDELYVAPRSQAGRLKVSIHASGYCQYGPTEPVRRDIRPGDRFALDRWEQAPPNARGLTPLLAVELPDSELVGFDRQLEPRVRRAPSAGPGTAQLVTLWRREASATDLVPLDALVLGRLRQPRGCEIVVVARTTHFDERTMFRPDGTVPTPWWQLPPSAAGDASRLVLLGQDHHGAEMRWFTEVQAWRGDTKPITVESFEGVVRNWEDRPRGPERQNDLRFCAILVLPPDGPTELYVDTRARCNLDALGRDATRCARVGREFGFDSEWDQLPDGSWTTGLGTGKVVAADLADGRGGRVPVDPSDRF